MSRHDALTARASLEPRRWRRDGWEAGLRFGAIVPHADIGPECELGAMAWPNVSVHAGRLYFSAMRAGGEMDETIPHAPVASFADAPYLDDAVEHLAASPLDVLGLAFTSSAYKHGSSGEQQLVERLAPRARGIPLTTTCLAAAAAFDALGSRRIALVNPPWFDADLDQAVARYFEEQSFNIVHHGPCGLPSGQRHITPDGLFSWIRKIVSDHRVDTVFIAGNGQRAVGIIDEVESTLGIRMVAANQLIFWHGLKLTGKNVEISDYGKLFQTQS